MSEADADMEARDFFRDGSLFVNPYPYYDTIRARCPVQREPNHDVVMITGLDEAVAVYSDQVNWSNCNTVAGPGFPVPLEGDDVSDLIDQHRDELPFSDQLPSFDPPYHTAQRGLLMRLITPKRMKENEEFMWRLADRQLEEFLERGRCEFVGDYASTYTLLVVADLLGVPETDFGKLRSGMARPAERALGEQEHRPLEYLYDQFTAYIEDRRQHPQGDVMTSLATATFPDGSTPPVKDVALIAANLFAAGQETTVRLLTACSASSGSGPISSSCSAASGTVSPTSSRRPFASRARSRARSGCRVGRRRLVASASLPARPSSLPPARPTTIRGASTSPTSFRWIGRTPGNTSPSATASTPVPGHLWPGPRPG